MHASLTFFGGAQTVTGSKFLLQLGQLRVLVDCGLFQGLKELRLQNWAPFPVDPQSIDAVVLTHAHLDHVGYLPLLVKGGFKGPVYSTVPTRALAEIILLDASRIQEEDALKALRGGYSKHKVPQPLFTVEEARAAMARFAALSAGPLHSLGNGAQLRFLPSGHILGSALVEISFGGKRLLFTGDLGRQKPLTLRPRDIVTETDYLVMESTYGDRCHPRESVLRALGRELREALDRGGDVLIPCFAVGRSQDLLFLLSQLKRQNQLPDVPICFDSPMGIAATTLLFNFPDWHRLSPTQIKELREAALFVEDIKFSQTIVKSRKQKIVIAGSGMMTGGRILNHLEKALPDASNTVLLVGYQASGTRGRQLKDGLPEVKMMGRFVPVKARIVDLPGLSAHADQRELLSWLRNFKHAPLGTFLVHGEPQATDILRTKIESSLGWKCHVPARGAHFDLF